MGHDYYFEFSANSSKDGIWSYDILKQEFSLSKEWKKRLGFAQDEKLGYFDYLGLIPDDNRFDHHNAMHDVLENHSGELEYVHFTVQYPLITKSGEELEIEDIGNIFFNDDKKPVRIAGFHRDITDKKSS